MKKSILAVAGVAALAGVVAPVAGVFADNPQDSLKVTISDSCTISYGEAAHANGNGSWGTSAEADTLSITLANDAVDTAIGTTTMSVTCNGEKGYNVTLAAVALDGANTQAEIPYTTKKQSTDTYAQAPAKGTSSWGVKSGDNWIADGGVVTTESEPKSAKEFTVTYGAGTSATQAADVYKGTATYSVTKKSS